MKENKQVNVQIVADFWVIYCSKNLIILDKENWQELHVGTLSHKLCLVILYYAEKPIDC